MKFWGRLAVAIGLVLLAFSFSSQLSVGTRVAQAQDTPPDGPKRKTMLTVAYIEYYWWLIGWRDNTIRCTIKIEHEGTPTSDEILTACGEKLHDAWFNTEPCHNYGNCTGMYLHLAKNKPGERVVEVELPVSKVWLSISGCEMEPPENRCTTLPNLHFVGEEPLPNERIIRIQGAVNNEPFSCAGNECDVPLLPTGEQGVPVEFWADSSFGDSSQHFTAQVRVVPWGNFMDPENPGNEEQVWYVDVLSDQWRGARLASCTDVWQVFPDVGGPPAWLTTPERVEDLASTQSLYYLAGMLIANGYVDASQCPDNGLQAPRVANGCGVEIARPAVIEWQNRFDGDILKVSQETGIPAQLMKNVFGRESQFWPGIYKTYREAGLGQLTEGGADTMLLWNPSFFAQYCPLILSDQACKVGFGNLPEEEKNILRGALVKDVNASCPECPVGIDLSQAHVSISIFARGLQANCEQVGRILYNATRQSAGQVSGYVDLWKFTLANYNAGSGCLEKAVADTWTSGYPLDWEHISERFEPACQGAIDYVNDISSIPQPTPTPTPAVQPEAPQAAETQETPPPDETTEATPTPTAPAETPEETPEPTATPEETEEPTPTP